MSSISGSGDCNKVLEYFVNNSATMDTSLTYTLDVSDQFATITLVEAWYASSSGICRVCDSAWWEGTTVYFACQRAIIQLSSGTASIISTSNSGMTISTLIVYGTAAS